MSATRVDLVALVASVREVLNHPDALLPQTGNAALDRALVALAEWRLRGPTLSYLMTARAELDRQSARQ